MSFAYPMWLLLILAIPTFLWVYTRARLHDRKRLDLLLSPAMFDRLGTRHSLVAARVRLAAFAGGVLFLSISLARPQWGVVRERVERTGVDIAFVLDTSLSMEVEDVSPNRFFLAKAGLSSLMTRLPGDRFSLVAFEGEAYPLVPLTLDADAVALFLETLEPGFVPMPGSNLRAGLEAGIATFVDPARMNRVIVLVSDGEDLEDGLSAAIDIARQAGVVVHVAGVGSLDGGPVPNRDAAGERDGYKLENGNPVISKLNPENLEKLAQATGGRFVQLTPKDTSLSAIAAAIEGMENRQAANEFSFRKQERFQIPLALSFACFILGLYGPLMHATWRRPALLATVVVALFSSTAARADVKDEILARPSRETSRGLKAYEEGDAARALEAFEKARLARPQSPITRFNEAVAQVKAGKAAEAIDTFTALSREKNDLGFEANYNLGNAHLAGKQLPAAVAAYRDALRLRADDTRARRNLEIALKQQKEQQEQQKQQEQQQQNEKQDPQKQPEKNQDQQQQQKPEPQKDVPPKNAADREKERFEKETGMSKDRAMQLLKALEQNEKSEQKKKLALERSKRRKGKDW